MEFEVLSLDAVVEIGWEKEIMYLNTNLIFEIAPLPFNQSRIS
jgi:hypothetical protein